MPIPKPKKDEDKEKFMERCMSDGMMNNEYPDNKQRYAICMTQWKEKDKKENYNIQEERRYYEFDKLNIELRHEDNKVKIVGHAAVFEQLSVNLGGFVEKIQKGAFLKAIKKSDTRALFNHDTNFILGRKSSKTLILKEDDTGLYTEIIPPDTQLIRDLVLEPIKRGDIREQSFGFIVKIDEWLEEKGKVPIRTIIEVDQLFDVSPVTFPAYPQTDVALRSLEYYRNICDETIALNTQRETSRNTENKIYNRLLNFNKENI